MRDNDEDRVDAVRGTPTDRVRWGPILAGTFAALTTLAILSTLGAAIGLSSYDRGQDDIRNFAMAGGVWGILSTIVAFALGGWLSARSSAIRGSDNGLLNGVLVAAFGIPLILFMVGSAATAMSSAEVANNRDPQPRGQQDTDNAITASARNEGAGDTGDTEAANANKSDSAVTDAERARQAGSRSAWGVLATMVLAVAAAATSGFVAARREDDGYRDTRRLTNDDRSNRA